MLRVFYVCLLYLHPRRFRERFAQEMLWIFDQAARDRHVGSLFVDGILSLWRQWAMRPEFHEQPMPALDGLPAFHTGAGDAPRSSALFYGAVLSLLTFSAVCYILSHSNSRTAPAFLLGSHNHSFSHFLQTHTVSAAPADLNMEVKLKPEPGAFRLSRYFQMMPVLKALDTDQDGVISAAEIANAATALLTLDRNGDNKLSAEECGLGVPHPIDAPQKFMRFHPVLAALDSNHDGEISSSEILNAPAALRTLDKNRDGRLTEDELIPDPSIGDPSK